MLHQSFEFSQPQNTKDLEFNTVIMGITDLIHVKHDYIEGAKCTALNNVEVWLPKHNAEGNSEGKWVV